MQRVFIRVGVERTMLDRPSVIIHWVDRYVDVDSDGKPLPGEDGREVFGNVVLQDADAAAFCDSILDELLAVAGQSVAAKEAQAKEPGAVVQRIMAANEAERRASAAERMRVQEEAWHRQLQAENAKLEAQLAAKRVELEAPPARPAPVSNGT